MVTATPAPVSTSTACSALWAKCMQPSFICVARHQDRAVFPFRIRTLLWTPSIHHRQGSQVGVSILLSCAGLVRTSWHTSPVSRRTVERSAALVSNVVATKPMVRPFRNPEIRSRPTPAAPSRTPADAFPDQSAAAFARSSFDRLIENALLPPDAQKAPVNHRCARQYRARSRSPRRSRPAATGSTRPRPDAADPPDRLRTSRTAPRRTRRTGCRPTADSGGCRGCGLRQHRSRHPHRLRLHSLPPSR